MYQVGLILEGGGMRGVYTAGVLDFFLKENIEIQNCYGVSAGLLNGMNYVAKQVGRTYRTVVNYIHDKNYCSVYSLLTTGNFFGTDMLYNRIPNELDPFDYETFANSKSKLTAVYSNADTGQAEYRKLTDIKKEMCYVQASCSLPLLSRMVSINGTNYLDGGITDSIPIEKAMRDGNKKNIVILTRHDGYQKKEARLQYILGKVLYPNHKELLQAGRARHLLYNRQLELVKKQEQMKQAFVIRPEFPVTISRGEKDKTKLKALYEQGYMDAKHHYIDILEFLHGTSAI
ncbi:MAG: patatin family protein [Lachnospiraceae bacterium]